MKYEPQASEWLSNESHTTQERICARLQFPNTLNSAVKRPRHCKQTLTPTVNMGILRNMDAPIVVDPKPRGRDTKGRFVRGQPNPVGRAKGVKDHDTSMLALVRQVVSEAGYEGLRAFKDQYPADFWRIAAKLIPAVKELGGINGEPIELRQVDAPPRPGTYEEWLQARVSQRLAPESDPPQ